MQVSDSSQWARNLCLRVTAKCDLHERVSFLVVSLLETPADRFSCTLRMVHTIESGNDHNQIK